MSDINQPFQDLRSVLSEAIERLQSPCFDHAELRTNLHALDGSIGRYCEVFYPLPYKRPDDAVLDILTEAVRAIDSLTQKLK